MENKVKLVVTTAYETAKLIFYKSKTQIIFFSYQNSV